MFQNRIFTFPQPLGFWRNLIFILFWQVTGIDTTIVEAQCLRKPKTTIHQALILAHLYLHPGYFENDGLKTVVDMLVSSADNNSAGRQLCSYRGKDTMSLVHIVDIDKKL